MNLVEIFDLYNEVLNNEGIVSICIVEEIVMYGLGVDCDFYFDIDWLKEMLREYIYNMCYIFNVRGGFECVCYFVFGVFY